MCIVVIAGYVIWAVYELVPLYKQEYWHDFWTNIILGSFTLTIALLLCFNVDIPTPEQPIRQFLTLVLGK